jgi:hypothetical protein
MRVGVVDSAGAVVRGAKIAGTLVATTSFVAVAGVAAVAAGTVLLGYEAARDFAMGLLHSPNA